MVGASIPQKQTRNHIKTKTFQQKTTKNQKNFKKGIDFVWFLLYNGIKERWKGDGIAFLQVSKIKKYHIS